MKPSRRNPAIAQRYHRDGTIPARLTRGHHKLPETEQAAARVKHLMNASYVNEAQPGVDPAQMVMPTYLGRGNFGLAYSVPTRDGVVAVKLPADTNVHRTPWSLGKQRQNIMHEVGIANELRAKGVTVVPIAVYAEVDGTPAMVREYGEPVTALTGEEYAELEQQLLDVERKHGFQVRDEITLYRRPDGTVFVGDVGLWEHPKKRKAWSSTESYLSGLLDGLSREGYSQKAVAIGGVAGSVPNAVSIIAFGKYGFPADTLGRSFASDVVKKMAAREARSIPASPELRRILSAAQRRLDLAAKSRPNGARRKTPRRRV